MSQRSGLATAGSYIVPQLTRDKSEGQLLLFRAQGHHGGTGCPEHRHSNVIYVKNELKAEGNSGCCNLIRSEYCLEL